MKTSLPRAYSVDIAVTHDLESIVQEIDNELDDVFERFGQQDHPIHPDNEAHHSHMHSDRAELWKSLNDQRVKDKRLAWDGIVLEEVYEAFAETDPGKQRAELIQAAAMCIATIECLDRANG